ncbi:MAG: hypothetical protein ACKVW3_09250 [Phycisphaerales bacterium]
MTTPVQRDEFFVGYLPTMPRAIGRRTRVVAAALGLAALMLAGLVGAAQSDAGGAVWDADPATVEGLFVARPTPMVVSETPSGLRAVLLVGAGKCGAFGGYCGPGEDWRGVAEAFAGKMVRASGTLLHRGDHAMLELDTGPRAVAVMEDGERRDRIELSMMAARKGSSVIETVVGELVDAKCYLGAMKPGTGKVHRACAIRCIEGGIPAMIVDARPDGTVRGILLVGADGRSPMPSEIRDLVGDAVSVSGPVGWIADLGLVSSSAIRRR